MAENNQNPQNTQDIPVVSPHTQDIPAQNPSAASATGQIPAQPIRTGQFPAQAPVVSPAHTGQIPAQGAATPQRELLKGKPLPKKVAVPQQTGPVPAQPAAPAASAPAPPVAAETPEAPPVPADAAPAAEPVADKSATAEAAAAKAAPAKAATAKTAKKKEPKAKKARAATKSKAASSEPGAAAEGDKTAEPAAQAEKRPPKPKTDPEILRIRKEERNRASRRRNRQFIGFALAILIVVGAISIVRGGVDLVRSMLNSDEERLQYQELYEPLVWFDILPFESVSLVDENSIKQVAIWGVLNEKQDQLERTEYGEPLVPVSDVDQYAARIFGPDFRFSIHASFEDPVEDLRYIFDEEAQAYAAPVTGLMPQYLASVVEIQREGGGVKRVTIGYVSTRTGDDQVIAAPDYEHPAKYMDYMLRRDGNEYYLYAIVNNTTHAVVPATGESAPGEEAAVLEDELTDSVPQSAAPAASSSEPQPEDSSGAQSAGE